MARDCLTRGSASPLDDTLQFCQRKGAADIQPFAFAHRPRGRSRKPSAFHCLVRNGSRDRIFIDDTPRCVNGKSRMLHGQPFALGIRGASMLESRRVVRRPILFRIRTRVTGTRRPGLLKELVHRAVVHCSECADRLGRARRRIRCEASERVVSFDIANGGERTGSRVAHDGECEPGDRGRSRGHDASDRVGPVGKIDEPSEAVQLGPAPCIPKIVPSSAYSVAAGWSSVQAGVAGGDEEHR